MMTSPISAIDGFTAISPITSIGSSIGDSTPSGPNADFAGMLSEGLQNVQGLQKRSEELAVKVADGTLADPAQYTMASTEAALAVQLTMAVRNKAVEAFQEIMRMQA
jgi:flagellar hook-basal body complex protein FliE